MNNFRTYYATFWIALLVPVVAIGQESSSEKPSMSCDIGPVNKTYGKTEWLVYSCADSQTVILVSAPGNPAMPFIFMFHPRENRYLLHGEGTGKKEATEAAFNELRVLAGPEIQKLIEQTKKVPKERP